MNKQQLVDSIISEIMSGVRTRISHIVREEIDIERKRIRKQLLEELRERMDEQQEVQERYRPEPQRARIVAPVHQPQLTQKKKARVDTGDQMLNAILEETQAGMEDMVPEMRFEAESTIDDVSKQMITETRGPRTSQPNGELWKPPEGEGYNFDPTHMDPAQIDWSKMVDALENTTALPGDRK